MDESKFLELTQRVDLFKGLNPRDAGKIFQHGLTQKVPKGDALFYKDTEGNQMYIILGGKIGIFRGQQLIAELRAGDMLGEMALVTSAPRSATALAMEDSSVFVLKETTFKKLLTKHVSVQMLLNIIGTLAKRLQDTNSQLARSEELLRLHKIK